MSGPAARDLFRDGPILAIPPAEMHAVVHTVAPFTADDEHAPDGNVQMRVEQGRRAWYATDGFRMVRLEGGVAEDAVEGALPRRMLLHPEDEDDEISIQLPSYDEDGHPEEVATVMTRGGLHISGWPGSVLQVDLRRIVEDALDRPYVSATVQTAQLRHLVGLARVHPAGVRVGHDVPSPTFWLHAGGGTLAVQIEWERYGKVRLGIPAEVDGEVHVAVNPRLFDDLIDHLPSGEVTLQLPLHHGDPVWARDGDWSMYLMPISPYPSLDEIRDQLEELLRRGYGLDELAVDEDGDYPFEVGDSLMYVRLVDARPPVVQVFSSLLRGVPASDELLAEINDINALVHFARVFWVRDQVLVESEIVASDLADDELGQAVRTVSGILADLRPALLARFGETHDHDSDEDDDDETG